MDEALEDQVARAMYEAHAAHRKPWAQLPLRDKLRWRASARAAITITGEFCAGLAEYEGSWRRAMQAKAPNKFEARDHESMVFACTLVASAIRNATTEGNEHVHRQA